MIGRSIVVTEREDDLGKGSDSQSKIDGNAGRRFVANIAFITVVPIEVFLKY